MYSTARNMTIFTVILGAINILMAAVLAFIYVPDFKMGWTFEFSAIIFLLSNSIVLMLLSIALRSITADLEVSEESNATQVKALKKKLEELENKITYR